MTTAQQMVKMADSGNRQRAHSWLRSIRKHHGEDHYRKLLSEIRELKEVGNIPKES